MRGTREFTREEREDVIRRGIAAFDYFAGLTRLALFDREWGWAEDWEWKSDVSPPYPPAKWRDCARFNEEGRWVRLVS